MSRIRVLVICLLVFSQLSFGSVIDVDNYQALTSDKRAYRVGEPIVILVVESTKAESTAATGVTKQMDISAGASDTVSDKSVGMSINGRGEGSGQTIRQGKATTQLSATIEEVVGSNLYKISGQQLLVVNGENQRVTLIGIIRAEDISKENTILSHRIADAEIEIHGSGAISDAQKQNIIFRVFTWLGIL